MRTSEGEGISLLSFWATAERNTTPQTPSSREVPNLKTPNPQNRCRGKRRAARFLSLELGVWSLEFGIWNLEFFPWALSFSKIEMRHAERARGSYGARNFFDSCAVT